MTSPPPLPDYQGAASQNGGAATSGSTDIWDLGKLYNVPVYLGTVTVNAPIEDRGAIRPNGPTRPVTTNQTGTTQDIMAEAARQWSQQATERQSKPGELTTFEQLQQALYSGGFYGQTAYDKIHVGQWTSQTKNALVEAIKSYEQATDSGQLPISFTEFITQNAGGNQSGGFFGDGSGAPARQIQLTDPDTIKAAAQAAAMQALGQGLTDDQLNTFVQQFQAAQSASQTSTAATVTGPDLSSQAMAFAQGSSPGAFHERQHQNYLDALVNLFAPAESRRPSVSDADVTPGV